jgi:hypothetical protein
MEFANLALARKFWVDNGTANYYSTMTGAVVLGYKGFNAVPRVTVVLLVSNEDGSVKTLFPEEEPEPVDTRCTEFPTVTAALSYLQRDFSITDVMVNDNGDIECYEKETADTPFASILEEGGKVTVVYFSRKQSDVGFAG